MILADLPVLGPMFGRGGQAGHRPRSVEQMYDVLEKAKHRQFSRENPETALERQRRLQLEDAARAVSALYTVRRAVPSVAKQAKITLAIARISADAVRLHEAEPREGYRRERFRALRREAERLEKAVGARQKPAAAGR